jgi:hypothetical protein
MTKTDPFEQFNALNPRLDNDDDGPDEELLARILAQPRTVGNGRPSRRRLWIVAGTVAVAGLATVAFAMLRYSPASEPTRIACAATDDPDGDVVCLPGAVDPVAACAELWTDGTLGSGATPPLAACVNDAGAVVVLPGESSAVCTRAGFDLLDLDADTSDAAGVLALEERLIDTFLNDCYGQDDALAEVRRILDDEGFADSAVTLAEDFPDGLDCAGISVDASEQNVIVAGVRPR